MSDGVAHKRWWQIFEVVFGIPFLVAVALQRIIPIPMPRGFFTPAIIAVGVVLIVVGVGLVVLARRELHAMRNQRILDFPRARSFPRVSSLSQGIRSILAALSLWRAFICPSSFPGG